jgi:hypothetical protein
MIGLAAQLVGEHRRLTRNRGGDGHPNAPALHGLNQRTEGAVAGKQRDLIDVLGELHGINRKLDVHVTLHLAATAGVDKLLSGLRYDGKAVVTKPVDERPKRRRLLIFEGGGVIERAHQGAATLEFREKALKVDVEAERLGGRVEIGAVDKKRDFGDTHLFSLRLIQFQTRICRAFLNSGAECNVAAFRFTQSTFGALVSCAAGLALRTPKSERPEIAEKWKRHRLRLPRAAASLSSWSIPNDQ